MMAQFTTLTSIIVLFCFCGGSCTEDCTEASTEGSCTDFDYGPVNGPSEWGDFCPACNGKSQSPIDIDPRTAVTKSLPELDGSFYQNRNVAYSFMVKNDGYTITMEFVNATDLCLDGGYLPGNYCVANFQLCWGADDSMGSEHTYKGQSYAMEGQWALYDADKYKSYDEASQHPGGTVRIAQMYPIVDERNKAMQAIVNMLPKVMEPGQNATSDETLTYDDLYSGYGANDYYAYDGSLTTPPCTEGVLWLVFPPKNGVTRDQVAAFRKVESPTGPLISNVRPVQPLNGREVVRSDKSNLPKENCPYEPHHAEARHRRGKSASRHRAARRHH